MNGYIYLIGNTIITMQQLEVFQSNKISNYDDLVYVCICICTLYFVICTYLLTEIRQLKNEINTLKPELDCPSANTTQTKLSNLQSYIITNTSNIGNIYDVLSSHKTSISSHDIAISELKTNMNNLESYVVDEQ